MAFIYYEATERLAPGHVAGTFYNMDFECSVLDFSAKTDKDQSGSISKKVEVVVNGDEEFFNLSATNIQQADLPLWVEIYFSLRSGTSFTFDPYGSSTVPIVPSVFSMESFKYAPRRTAFETFDIPFLFRKFV